MKNNCDCNCGNITIKFEDSSEEIRLDAIDQSTKIDLQMAPVGNTIINERVEVLNGTCEYWNSMRDMISRKNVFYLYTDLKKKVDPSSGAVTYSPGLKIGDGRAYLIDLPFIGGEDSGIDITEEMIRAWNSKWRGYLQPGDLENLVFTTN